MYSVDVPARTLIVLAAVSPAMAVHEFDRETLLDTVVNLVPLGIIVFFLVLYALLRPWTGLPALLGWFAVAVMVLSFVFLLYLTYETARRI